MLVAVVPGVSTGMLEPEELSQVRVPDPLQRISTLVPIEAGMIPFWYWTFVLFRVTSSRSFATE